MKGSSVSMMRASLLVSFVRQVARMSHKRKAVMLFLVTFFFGTIIVMGGGAAVLGERSQQLQQQWQQEEAEEETPSSTPVIGILSQPSYNHANETTVAYYYVAASYVKWLEAGGARSIPIPYDATDAELLDELYSQVNAILLPGGGSDLPYSVGYLLDKVVEGNAAGNYFPVWGTCLGFEYLVQHFAGGCACALQSGFDAENISLPLDRVVPVGLYRDSATYRTVRKRNVTLNNHVRGITPDKFRRHHNLTNRWRITSVNRDRKGRPFVSTIEPLDPAAWPVYGVQYHPEKNAFEYATYPSTDIPYEAIDHTKAGIQFSLHTAAYFVELARRSKRRNSQHHVYNESAKYPTVQTYPERTGLAFEQIYVIPSASRFGRMTAAHYKKQS